MTLGASNRVTQKYHYENIDMNPIFAQYLAEKCDFSILYQRDSGETVNAITNTKSDWITKEKIYILTVHWMI